jgi:hypothetical protein
MHISGCNGETVLTSSVDGYISQVSAHVVEFTIVNIEIAGSRKHIYSLHANQRNARERCEESREQI